MVPTPLGNKRGKGGSDAGHRAFRRLDNQAEWQLLVYLPSTPCSQHCHGNSSSIQGFPECFCFQRRPFTLLLFPLTRLLPPVTSAWRCNPPPVSQEPESPSPAGEPWSVNNEFVTVLKWASC